MEEAGNIMPNTYWAISVQLLTKMLCYEMKKKIVRSTEKGLGTFQNSTEVGLKELNMGQIRISLSFKTNTRVMNYK